MGGWHWEGGPIQPSWKVIMASWGFPSFSWKGKGIGIYRCLERKPFQMVRSGGIGWSVSVTAGCFLEVRGTLDSYEDWTDLLKLGLWNQLFLTYCYICDKFSISCMWTVVLVNTQVTPARDKSFKRFQGVYFLDKWLVTRIYKPFKPFGRGRTTLLRGLTITMVIWDDPPSRAIRHSGFLGVLLGRYLGSVGCWNTPKNPWDVGFRVSSYHLFWGPEIGVSWTEGLSIGGGGGGGGSLGPDIFQKIVRLTYILSNVLGSKLPLFPYNGGWSSTQ